MTLYFGSLGGDGSSTDFKGMLFGTTERNSANAPRLWQVWDKVTFLSPCFYYYYIILTILHTFVDCITALVKIHILHVLYIQYSIVYIYIYIYIHIYIVLCIHIHIVYVFCTFFRSME